MSEPTILYETRGAVARYDAARDILEMHGAAKLTAPLVKVVFEKIGSDTEDDMTTVLNRLAAA